MTGAQLSSHASAARQARQLISRGLPALLVGGAVLIAAVWLLAWQLSDMLARTHVQQKMQDVAAKAQGVLRETGAAATGGVPAALSPHARQALADLARFRDIHRMELRDALGNVIWRNVPSVSQVRRDWPDSGGIVIERRNVDGLLRSMARFRTAMPTAGDKVLTLHMELDATPQLATYHRVATLVAKAITTVVLAAMLLMGWMLMLRAREQEALARHLEALENAVAAKEAYAATAQIEDLHRQIGDLSARNAALLHRMARLAGNAAGASPREAKRMEARRANGGEA